MTSRIKPLLLAPSMVFLFWAVGCGPQAPRAEQRPTLLLAAFGREAQLIEEKMTERKGEPVLGLKYQTGRLFGRPVVLVKTGVGKVNAAMTTSIALAHFRPAEVIFTGIAGGLNRALAPGDIVIATGTLQHDFGDISMGGFTIGQTKSPVDGVKNPVVIPADPRLLTLAQRCGAELKLQEMKTSRGVRTPKVISGMVATGDVFIASPDKQAELRQQHGADAVEMEGAAVAQVCLQLGTPCVVIRSLSDMADDKADVDMDTFHRVAAFNSASLVLKMMQTLSTQAATQPAR